MIRPDGWMNISQLKETTKIPSATVDRYLRDFATYLHFVETGRGKYYPPQTAAVLLRIYELSKDQRLTREEIEPIIQSEFNLALTVDDETDITTSSSLPALLTKDDVGLMIHAAIQEVAAAKDAEIASLREFIDEKFAAQERRLEERDQMLVQTLRTLQQSKEKKGFWSRLFGH